jgi:hypothetical protein
MSIHDAEELWSHLVQRGVIEPSLADYLQRDAREGWVPLGKVLLQEGALSMQQLMALLQKQAIEPELRLGDLAIREGWCTQERVDQALKIQRAGRTDLAALLHRLDVDKDLLIDALLDYVADLQQRIGEYA